MVALFVVVALLFLIASFGIGFILNMFAKRFPWTSTVVALAFGCVLFFTFGSAMMKIIAVLPVLIGGIAASLTIRTLQRRGFKMFG